jgi:drug/metabolite transporter (DMT)-like permease
MNDQTTQALDRTTLIAFAATVLIGGTNFVAVKFSNAELAPLYGAALRFAAAAVIFFAIAWIGRMELPRGAALLGASIYGLLSFGVAYAFLYVALLEISAGTTSVVLASVPLMTLALAVLHRQERWTLRKLAGGVLALGGIAALSYRDIGGELPTISLLAAVAGAFAAAESSVVVKGFPKSHPITTNAVGAAVGAAGLFAASAILGESWMLPEVPRTWAVLAWLSVVGSVGLFGAFVFVIKRWTASATVYALTLMPIVAVSLGALLAKEHITPEVVVGGAMVVSGVYVGALSPQRRRGQRHHALAGSAPVSDELAT